MQREKVVPFHFGVSQLKTLRELMIPGVFSLHQGIVFFLEVMAAVAQQEPRFRFVLEAPSSEEPLTKDHYNYAITQELYDYIADWGHELGMRPVTFSRFLLYNFLDLKRRLVGQSSVTERKEVLVSILVEYARHKCGLVQ